MPTSALKISRRSAIRAGGLSAASLWLAGTTPAGSAEQASPIDKGSVSDGIVTFPPIAAPNEASQPEEDPPLAPKDQIGFAVAALGRLSVEQILPAFAQSRKCKVTALVSGTPDKLKVVGAQYGISAENLYSYDEFDRIAQNGNVQVVYIVLPNSMHREYVLRAAAAKKHVLCEKPMATSSDEAQAMIEACARAGVKLMIAYRCRYQPHHPEVIKRAKRRIWSDQANRGCQRAKSG